MPKCIICNRTFINNTFLENHIQSHPRAAPFIKWVGGKTQILTAVLETFPSLNGKTYYEPFLGGGSVLFGLLASTNKPANIIVSDINEALIHCYINIRDNIEDVIRHLDTLKTKFEAASENTIETPNRKPQTIQEATTCAESYYYWIRQQYNSLDNYTTVQATAYFIFLNKTCFRGVYRMGPNGFNVPYGHYNNPGIFDPVELRIVSAAIKSVTFLCQPYTDILAAALSKKNCFIYMDPPYLPETATSFVGYTADGFSSEDHERLFTCCKELIRQKIPFVMSNSDVPLIHSTLGSRTTIAQINCKRSINSKKPNARTNEVLIRYLQ